jgi:hypothetical protein
VAEVAPDGVPEGGPASGLVAGVVAEQLPYVAWMSGPHAPHSVAPLFEVVHHARHLLAEVGEDRDAGAHDMEATGDDVELAPCRQHY